MNIFNNMSAKLTLMFASLFGLSLVVLVLASKYVIHDHATRHAVDDINATADALERDWLASSTTLRREAGLLAKDFGFRRAAATFHRPTIDSALQNLSARNGHPLALFVASDGTVYGHEGEGLHFPDAPDRQLDLTGRTGTLTISKTVYWAVAEPVRAPLTIGWLVFGDRLDAGDIAGSEMMPAQLLRGQLVESSTPFSKRALLQKGAAPPTPGDSAGVDKIERILPLPSLVEGKAYAMRLSFSIADASARYRTIAWKIAGLSVIAFLIVLAASWVLAKRIVRPISTLGHMIHRASEGEMVDVDVKGDDEVARLARGLSGMAVTISQLTHAAHHDSLTKLPNRHAFDACLARAFESDGEGQEARETGLILIDLDDFKSVNDVHGHPAGDALLQGIARRLDTAVSTVTKMASETGQLDAALPARLGGDEFAVVVTGTGIRGTLEAIACKFFSELQAPVVVGNLSLPAGASVGIAVAPEDGRRASDLTAAADAALYRAKRDGKGHFRHSAPERTLLHADAA